VPWIGGARKESSLENALVTEQPSIDVSSTRAERT
jgi:hypothetical protein